VGSLAIVERMRKTRPVPFLASSALVAVTLALAGCSAGATSAPPASGATAQAIVTEEPGPLHAAGQAFAEVPISAQQRARIEGLFRATEARHAGAWRDSAAARKELLGALADQVEAGAIDTAALAPKLEAAAAPWRKMREDDRAALVDLHAALSPEQRKAFVDAFRSEAMHHGFRGKGKHGDKGGHADKGEHARGERFGHAWKALDLTSDQKDKLKEAMHAAKEGHANGSKREEFARRRDQGKKALEAFASDTFTGEGLLPADKADARLEKMLRFAEIATPILTPEQRTKAAAMLRERAAHASESPAKPR
jgi:Spy/CpxP family protein refolding chaperone